MSLYVRVFTNFYAHRKVLRLRAALGTDANWIPPRLWAYAAENQPDGIFEGYTSQELAEAIGYTGDADKMLQALLQVGFLDSSPLAIHDWQEHNSYHQTFSERARKAAAARWGKSSDSPSETGNERKGKERSKHYSSIATSIQPLGADALSQKERENEILREVLR